MHGRYLEYPITLKYREGIYEKRKQVENIDELYCWIVEYIDKIKDSKTLYERIFQAGLKDTVNLVDERSVFLYELWQHYKFAPHLINSEPFYDANRIFNTVLSNGGFY